MNIVTYCIGTNLVGQKEYVQHFLKTSRVRYFNGSTRSTSFNFKNSFKHTNQKHK